MTELKEDEIRGAFDAVTYNVPVSKVIAGARRRQHRRRTVLGALPLAGLIAAGGYAVTYRKVNDDVRNMVACTSQFDQRGDMTIVRVLENRTPEETCLTVMDEDDWENPPHNLVRCVLNYPDGQGGALAVFAAPEGMTQREACSRLGAALPPEDNQ
jgi:hypothetical protein